MTHEVESSSVLSRRGLLLGGAIGLLSMLSGCARRSVSGDLRTDAIGQDSVRLRGRFTSAFYDTGGATTVICLSEIPLADFASREPLRGQVVVIELLWQPLAGQTPLDPEATNSSVRQIIFSGSQVGVYAGAGMVYPGTIGRSQVKFSLREVSLKLQDATAGFHDLLSPAEMTGTFSCRNDAQSCQRLRFAASQSITDAFGRTFRV